MINSPWEIKITSFGESLLLSSSTRIQVVPNVPFSLSPPLTSPGNSSAIMDHFNASPSWVSTRTEVSLSVHTDAQQEHLPWKTFPSNVQVGEDLSADNKHRWKYFSSSLSKRRMGSHSIYDMNKGLGKMKYLVSFVTMVTTPFGRPSDFSLLTEWFVTEFQKSVLFIIFWLKQLFFSFVFALSLACRTIWLKCEKSCWCYLLFWRPWH